MTDNEIKKALELCGGEYECHNGCPYYNNGQFKCRDLSIYRDALDLINRLETKNSNLTSDLTSLQNDLTSLKNAYKQCAWERDVFQTENERLTHITRNLIGEIKAEAYTEFAEWVKEIDQCTFYGWIEFPEDRLDSLLKEKVGSNEKP